MESWDLCLKKFPFTILNVFLLKLTNWNISFLTLKWRKLPIWHIFTDEDRRHMEVSLWEFRFSTASLRIRLRNFLFCYKTSKRHVYVSHCSRYYEKTNTCYTNIVVIKVISDKLIWIISVMLMLLTGILSFR